MTDEQPTRSDELLGSLIGTEGRLLSAEDEIARLRVELEQVRRDRDVAQQKAKLMVCCYCGLERPKPEPFNKETMVAEIVEHLKTCPTHPANAYFEAMDRAEAAEQSRERMKRALEKVFAGMKAVRSLVNFYTEREMNAPANSQEAVRDARENNIAFSNGLEAARKALEGES